MVSVVERRPVGFTFGLTAGLIVLTLLTRAVLEVAIPQLTLHGIGLILNWTIVAGFIRTCGTGDVPTGYRSVLSEPKKGSVSVYPSVCL